MGNDKLDKLKIELCNKYKNISSSLIHSLIAKFGVNAAFILEKMHQDEILRDLLNQMLADQEVFKLLKELNHKIELQKIINEDNKLNETIIDDQIMR